MIGRTASPLPEPEPQAEAAGWHDYLWFLPDGTGLHAPAGRLVPQEGTGRLCCHLCGEWFTALGTHVRAHGFTAGAYRQAMSLPPRRALVASSLSALMARNTRSRWAAARPGQRRTAHPADGIGGLPDDQQAAAGTSPGRQGRSPPAAAPAFVSESPSANGRPDKTRGSDDRPPGDRSEGWTIVIAGNESGRDSRWAQWLRRQAAQ